MKKTYINPAMEIYTVKANQQLLAGSMAGKWDENADPSSADSRSLFFDFDEE